MKNNISIKVHGPLKAKNDPNELLSPEKGKTLNRPQLINL